MLIIKNGKTIGALQLFRVRKTGIVARQNAKDVVIFHGEEEQDRKVMKKKYYGCCKRCTPER